MIDALAIPGLAVHGVLDCMGYRRESSHVDAIERMNVLDIDLVDSKDLIGGKGLVGGEDVIDGKELQDGGDADETTKNVVGSGSKELSVTLTEVDDSSDDL